MAYFQWINASIAEAPPHRPPLVLNMDETALVRHASGVVGTVVKGPHPKAMGDVATLNARRSYITYVATITHDADVQPCLPQILIGNQAQFTAANIKSWQNLPSNLHIWRCKSAWNNHALVRKYLSLLASSLGHVLQDRYVILILDVARCHIHHTILAHARRCGIRLCYIPAAMTPELQPCDTHLFSRFKSAFKEAWRDEKALSLGGSISTTQWLQIVVRTIDTVLPTADWSKAFAADGALSEQMFLANSLCEKLGWGQGMQAPEGPPSPDIARLVFPRNMKVNAAAYIDFEHVATAHNGVFKQSVPRKRRALPSTFIGTLEKPLTID